MHISKINKFSVIQQFLCCLVWSCIALCHLAHGSYAYATATPSHTPQYGAVSKFPIPRFANLKAKTVNARIGPGPDYAVKYTFMCAGYPIRIIGEFENWRLVEDINQYQGWVNVNLLTNSKHALIIYDKKKSSEVILRRLPNITSKPIARLKFGVVAKLKSCENGWCKLKTQNPSYSGWLEKRYVWGDDE